MIIKNKHLTVEIDTPGQSYSGSRFDWTGFITQITYKNNITFCVPEQYEAGKGSGGIGFCNEFGIDAPIGYEESAIGESFPKIGVGKLTKDSEHAYDFFHPYHIKKAKVTFTQTDEECTFVSTIDDANGYENVLTKTISIEGNQLTISYRLENTGCKTIKTNEYCHNFIGINQTLVDSHYTLTIPSLATHAVHAGEVTVHDNSLTWPKNPQEDFYVLFETSSQTNKYHWQLYCDIANAGVRDISPIQYTKFALWGCSHVISPELFVSIDLKPQETMNWRRVYEFYTDKK